MTNLDHAVEYFGKGYNLIPVGANKRPIIAEWKHFQDNPASLDQIIHWWTERPNANLAAICGKHSGFFVIDVDLGADVSGLNLPLTKVVKTGSGGWHYYFKWQDRLAKVPNTVGLRPHVDLRGEGSYILIPPSVNEKGSYELVVDEPMADLDVKFIESLARPKSIGAWHERLKQAPLGQRNAGAAQLIGGLCKSMPPAYWEDTLLPFMEWWSQNRCTPPMSPQELATTFNSICSRSLQQDWSSWIKPDVK